ncbi:CHST11 [Branchiostoma lanceolatum]|uniref:Carbohydrate sulfotransferase n=1 Tax=Branchiostoma lanceolatum TaxID=7740 RepID=A0A8J9ZJJ5_BRALA|nr:CHST11 [Branchiostoma lanceolatum]
MLARSSPPPKKLHKLRYNDSYRLVYCGPPPPPRKLHKLRYNDPYRLVYCDVAKAGSTTMKKILAQVDPNYQYIKENGLHDQESFKDLSLFQEGSRDLRDRLTNYTKFMIVREPLERLLSAYQDKFRFGRGVREYETNYGKHFLEVRTPNDVVRWQKAAARAAHSKARLNVTFAEFVRGLLTGEERYFNIHWQPQHLICHPCKIQYDYIGHLETMHDDVKYIMSKTGIIEKVAPPKQSARRAVNNMATMYADIPLDHIRQLGRMFAFDYTGYSFHFEETVRNIVEVWEKDLHLYMSQYGRSRA